MEEPTTPGWYSYDGSYHQMLIFLLDSTLEWHVISTFGGAVGTTEVSWDFVAMGHPMFRLKLLAALA